MNSIDREAVLSWGAAAIIMEFVTLFTLTLRLLGMNPFTIVFDIFIVYLPTAVLVNSIIFDWLKRRSNDGGSATGGRQMSENTAV